MVFCVVEWWRGHHQAASSLQRPLHFVVKLHLDSSSSRLKCLFVVMFGYLGPFQWRFPIGKCLSFRKEGYIHTEERKGSGYNITEKGIQNWCYMPKKAAKFRKKGQIQKPLKYANGFSVLIAHALQLILSAFNFTGCGKKSVLSRWSQIKSVNFNQTSHFLVHRSGTVQYVSFLIFLQFWELVLLLYL